MRDTDFGGALEFALLGPLEIRGQNGSLPLGGPKQRAVLALLLLDANRVVPRTRLIDGLWGEQPPETAIQAVQVYVAQLRKLLPAGMLVTRRPGYMLEVEPDAVDVKRFERLVSAARETDAEETSALLREALGLWRGPALADISDEPFAPVEAGRLENLRLAALEDRIEADLALGRPHELVGELESLVARHPHRERLRSQLMLALYRAGRQAEALAAFRAARTTFDELGLETSPELRRLEQQILAHDPALEPPRANAADERLPLPGALVPGSPFPFVGRAAALARLRSLLERANDGVGSFALVAGEAGGGKTRLVRELASDSAAAGALVLYGASDAT